MDMTFDEILRGRVYRILRRNTRFENWADGPGVTPEGLQLADGEEILGVYRDGDENPTSLVVVTSLGLHVWDDQWIVIAYSDMDKVSVPQGEDFDKTKADTLVIQRRNGEQVTVMITGGDGRLRDLWQFDHFVMRVIGDYKKRHSPET